MLMATATASIAVAEANIVKGTLCIVGLISSAFAQAMKISLYIGCSIYSVVCFKNFISDLVFQGCVEACSVYTTRLCPVIRVRELFTDQV